MDATLVIVAGISVFFNFATIYWKWIRGRQHHAMIDAAVFFAASYMLSGTMTGMTISMIGSALFSIFLLIVPPERFING